MKEELGRRHAVQNKIYSTYYTFIGLGGKQFCFKLQIDIKYESLA
jgi:hypothetical protein